MVWNLHHFLNRSDPKQNQLQASPLRFGPIACVWFEFSLEAQTFTLILTGRCNYKCRFWSHGTQLSATLSYAGEVFVSRSDASLSSKRFNTIFTN